MLLCRNEVCRSLSRTCLFPNRTPLFSSGLTYRSNDNTSDTVAPLLSESGHLMRRGPHPLARRRSRGSIATESTFPMRADAYHATNLRPDGAANPILPPNLPYPSLTSGSLNSMPTMRSVVSNSSAGGGARSAGGFFSVIGRKSSVRNKDRTLAMFANANAQARPAIRMTTGSSSGGSASSHGSSLAPGTGLTSSASLPANPRPVQIDTTPTVKGGPRAPAPRRASTIAPPPGLVTTGPPLFASAVAPRSAPPTSTSVAIDPKRSLERGPPRNIPLATLPQRPPIHPSQSQRALNFR